MPTLYRAPPFRRKLIPLTLPACAPVSAMDIGMPYPKDDQSGHATAYSMMALPVLAIGIDGSATAANAGSNMGLSEEELEYHAQQMLEMLGRSFQGIRLKCRNCGEHAMAHSVGLAEMLGWANVRHVEGNRYGGTCTECAIPKQGNPSDSGAG